MPIAHYRDDLREISKSATVPVPKKVFDVDHWYKAVARMIREIPRRDDPEIHVEYLLVTQSLISIRIYHKKDMHYSFIHIDRTKNSLGY